MSAMIAFFLGLSVGIAAALCVAAWALCKIGDMLTLRW